jgi:hypothetical protein
MERDQNGEKEKSKSKQPKNKRRETKRKIISLQTMMRSKDITQENRAKMENQILELRMKMESFIPEVDQSEIQKRREFLKTNPGLHDIFRALWLVVFVFTEDGYLSKDGYKKFNHALMIALLGIQSYDEVAHIIENDWLHDTNVFGHINQRTFFDILFEMIETWTEIMDPTYLAAFAWSLLDSIADTTLQPPKLRPVREIKCITKLENEAVSRISLMSIHQCNLITSLTIIYSEYDQSLFEEQTSESSIGN